MLRLILLVLWCLAAGGVALADPAPDAADPAAAADSPAETPDGPEPPGTEEAGETIIVYGERDIARKRAILERDLRRLGYKAHDKDGYTVYRPESPWEPSVVLYDQGFMILKRSPVRFEPPVKGSSNLRYLWCIPPFTPLCVRPGGQLVSKRKLQGSKTRLFDQIKPDAEAWQKAIVAQGTHERLDEELPRMLVDTWDSGAPIEEGGPELPSPEARRAAILNLWATRADTPEGASARSVIADFIRYEIQSSPTPASPAEIAAAEAKCACDQRVLSDPGPPPGGGSPPP